MNRMKPDPLESQEFCITLASTPNRSVWVLSVGGKPIAFYREEEMARHVVGVLMKTLEVLGVELLRKIERTDT